MRMSASGKAYRHVYGNEAQEVFLDGHVRAFEEFGGVPGRIRYDNLKTAVVKVLQGRDRLESERFVALRSPLRFESLLLPARAGRGPREGRRGRRGRPIPPATPGAGAPGVVVGRVERASSTPPVELDDARHIDGRHMTVAEHFALEVPTCARCPSPSTLASGCNCRVDTKARVCVRQNFYSVPGRAMPVAACAVRLGAESLDVDGRCAVVARHARSMGRKNEMLVLDHYLEVLGSKPGAFITPPLWCQARASGAFTAAHQRFWDTARRRLGDSGGTRALIEVLLLHRSVPAAAVLAGMERALGAGSVDPAVVAIEARRARTRRRPRSSPSGPWPASTAPSHSQCLRRPPGGSR